MSAAFIIDSSITISWCFVDEHTPATLAVQSRLMDETAMVPELWFLEIANVLLMAEKRGRITAARSQAFIDLLDTFDLEVDGGARRGAFTDLMPLARTHGLTAYDARYLELAIRTGLPLATLDKELGKAAASLGITVLGR